MINIVVFMLEMRTHTRISLMFLILSSWNIMDFLEISNTLLTWMLQKSMEVLMQMPQFTQQGFVLAAALKDLVCHLESPNSNALELRA